MAIHRGTVVAVRLFDEELKRLDRECVTQRLTRSDVLRLALDAYTVERKARVGISNDGHFTECIRE